MRAGSAGLRSEMFGWRRSPRHPTSRASAALNGMNNTATPTDRERHQNRNLVVPAEIGDSQKCSPERGVPDKIFTSHRAQKEKENHWRPDRSIEHLRPIGGPHVASQSERRAAQQRCRLRSFQIAAQQVAEQRAHEMDQDEIPVERDPRNPAVMERQRKKNP